MTNKRKIQRAKKAQNDTAIAKKRKRYYVRKLDIYDRIPMFDSMTGLMFFASATRVRKLKEFLLIFDPCTMSSVDYHRKLMEVIKAE